MSSGFLLDAYKISVANPNGFLQYYSNMPICSYTNPIGFVLVYLQDSCTMSKEPYRHLYNITVEIPIIIPIQISICVPWFI